jgi:hypothetical protein
MLCGLCLYALSLAAFAEDLALNPAHPERYTVVRGDTLWDIAGRFLVHPWQWPEIWHNNPGLANPHLIYPGDVLVLAYENGRSYLRVETPSELRLSPEVRVTPTAEAIPVIPMNAIHQFLSKPRVMGHDELAGAPVIADFGGEHIVGGIGDRIYARLPGGGGGRSAFTVFRAGQVYKDAESGEVLGHEAIYVGEAQLEQAGDPAVLLLTRTEREVLVGDRLMPVEQEAIPVNFEPHAPKAPIRGHIISVVDGVSQIGQYQVVVIDRGSSDGLEMGHVLDIYQSGRNADDIVDRRAGKTLKLPYEKAGLLMVFRSFERVSYALVMHATRNLHVLDLVQSP